MQKYLNQINQNNAELKKWVNTNLSNYLKKEEVSENISEIEHILDYLQSEDAPKRLKKMSYEEANKNAKKWLKKLVKKGNNITEIEDSDYTVKIDFKDGFKLVQLVSKRSFEREGNLMGHCVASYFGKEVFIYSLRDSKNQPHCTIEVTRDEDSINQIKGKGNGSIHPKYIEYVLETLKFFNIEVRSSEMGNLGYSDLESSIGKGFLKFLKKNFEGVQVLKFNGKKYFYEGSKMKFKKSAKNGI